MTYVEKVGDLGDLGDRASETRIIKGFMKFYKISNWGT